MSWIRLEQLETRDVPSVYDVGPGLAYPTVGSVPWNALAPGDVVNIHWQPSAYHEKIGISATGTPDQPIQINGIPGPDGELPVLDGTDATSSPNAPRYGYTPIEDLGLIVIFPDSTQSYYSKPGYLDINNLQLQGANSRNTYTGYDGDVRPYAAGASALWTTGSTNVTIHGCFITDNDNGVFAKSNGDVPSTTYNITLDGNTFWGNGVAGSDQYHNSYIEADGAVYQYNLYLPLRNGAQGNALKDRSAGTVIRYNTIQDGGHLLDLVDAQDGYAVIGQEDSYHQTFVYGNVLISDPNGPTYLIHYGGDSGIPSHNRNGTLYFYNNTVVSQDDRSHRWRTILFELTDANQAVDVRNNILFDTSATPGAIPTILELAEYAGTIDIATTNWISPGWIASKSAELGQSFDGTISDTQNLYSNAANDPGFVDLSGFDVRILPTSDAIGQGGALADAAANQPVLSDPWGDVRSSVADLGAFDNSAYGM
jgi:hypothetical protein